MECYVADISHPWWDGKSCVACATFNETTPAWNRDSRQCVGKCQEGQIPDKQSVCRTCLEQDENTPFLKDRACASKCDETYDEKKVCKTCEIMYKELPYWDGEKCIGGCTRTRLLEERELCIDADTCPAGLKLSTNGKLCVDSCELWMTKKTTNEDQCVDSCPLTAPLREGDQCKECPNDGFWDLKLRQCVDSCSDWAQESGFRVCEMCETTSPETPYWDG